MEFAGAVPNTEDYTGDLLRELQRLRDLETFDPLADLDRVPLEPADKPQNHRLTQPALSSLAPLAPAEPLDQVRANLPAVMHEYADRSTQHVLLVAAPAGIGKSHAGIQFVQERAALGERWYWAAQNHSMFDDLSAQPNFDTNLWYHWQPMDGTIDGAPACKYPEAQRSWSAKGYKARNLCWWLCGRQKNEQGLTYMDAGCPFRAQGMRQAPVTFIMHQHLFTGLDDGRADGIVIDESFVGLFAREKYVPGDKIKQANIDLAILALANLLHTTWLEIREHLRPAHLSGKALLDILTENDVYQNACTQLDAMAEAEELKRAAKFYRNPPISDPTAVENLQTIYMDEFTRALAPEYLAWKANKPLWAERCWLDRDGLHYVTPAIPWRSMPKKIIILDATGLGAFYKRVFLREVEEYRPNVERQGRVFQVAGRMYAKGNAVDKAPAAGEKRRKNKKYDLTASKTTLEFIETAREIIAQRKYKNVAVVCSQAAEKFIQEGLHLTGADTLHFYKLRGRNDLQGRDCVFVFGTPTPSERTITNIALAMDPRRTEPIYKIDDTGNHVPIYVPIEREFRLGGACYESEFTGTAARVVGCYPDPLLAAIQQQMREAEILQAIYRARLITNPADVWIFSSIPIQEIALDGLYNDPPIAPGQVSWRLWLRLRAWCDQQAGREAFGYAELAAALEMREDYLRALKALDAIQEFYGAEIERVRIPPAGAPKSRPREMLKISRI